MCLYFAKETHVLAPACIPRPLIHVTPQDTGRRVQGKLCSLHLQVTKSGPRFPGSVRGMVAFPTAQAGLGLEQVAAAVQGSGSWCILNPLGWQRRLNALQCKD